MKKQDDKLKFMVVAAVFAAMTTVLTYFVKIPTTGGYIHLGDAVIYLAACVLPAPYAMLSAGIGGGLADLFGGYSYYILPTFIIKALIASVFSNKAKNILTTRNTVMAVPAGIITVLGYYVTKVFMLCGDKMTASEGFFGALFDISVWGSALYNIPENTVQAIGSAVVFWVLAFALDKAHIKQKMFLGSSGKTTV